MAWKDIKAQEQSLEQAKQGRARKNGKTPEPPPEDDPTLDELEATVKCEIEEAEQTLRQDFRERMQKENDRFRDTVDTEYWFCVCFTNRAQKQECLKAMGLHPDDKYLDGKDLMKALKRAQAEPDLDFAQVKKFDRDYVSMSMDD